MWGKVSLRTALAVLKLVLWTRLASNKQRSTCFCLPHAGIKGVIFIIIQRLPRSEAEPQRVWI